MTTLYEKVVAIELALREAGLPHAVGGALALAYHVDEPRATRDIDLNIFIDAADARRGFEALPPEVEWTDHDLDVAVRDGQRRVYWGEHPVDVFYITHRFHREAALRVVEVPFEDTTIPILAATELTVLKAFFNRTRDWADIEAMLEAQTIDVHRALGWLVDLTGSDDERVERLRELASRELPAPTPRFAPENENDEN